MASFILQWILAIHTLPIGDYFPRGTHVIVGREIFRRNGLEGWNTGSKSVNKTTVTIIAELSWMLKGRRGHVIDNIGLVMGTPF